MYVLYFYLYRDLFDFNDLLNNFKLCERNDEYNILHLHCAWPSDQRKSLSLIFFMCLDVVRSRMVEQVY